MGGHFRSSERWFLPFAAKESKLEKERVRRGCILNQIVADCVAIGKNEGPVHEIVAAHVENGA